MPRLTTRDYKRSSRNSSAARLKEFGLGLIVGVVLTSAAFLIVGAHARHRADASAHAHANADSQGDAPHAPAPDDTSSNSPDPAAGSESASSRSGSTHTGAPAPQYDFYRMLPKFKVPVPHDDDHPSHAPPPAAARQALAKPAARPAASSPSYLLQVGSYRSSAEAEQVRARLARAGIAAQVQHIVEGSRTLNRVRIGPLSDVELAKVREQLRALDIHALVIRADR
ncbi:MAG TPA: SPOR domain-containing protein [Steroidobacteraceae bacterium]|nr:SPOR domain-containing protein [Steroidobacteraceae bacterium]